MGTECATDWNVHDFHETPAKECGMPFKRPWVILPAAGDPEGPATPSTGYV